MKFLKFEKFALDPSTIESASQMKSLISYEEGDPPKAVYAEGVQIVFKSGNASTLTNITFDKFVRLVQDALEE